MIFISTSTCGAMPAYWLNLVCCLFMGLGAGGMLPVALTLISETVPAAHRGWLMVLVGGCSKDATKKPGRSCNDTGPAWSRATTSRIRTTGSMTGSGRFLPGASSLLALALYGLPLSLPVACLYGLWSSRKTVVLVLAVNVIAMLWFVLGGDGIVRDHALLEAFLIVPTWSIGLMASVLAIYAAEIYPTKIRSRGSGLAAGATKFGGMLILALAAAFVAAPSIAMTALIAVVPMGVALILLLVYGPETRRRPLEQITVREIGVVRGSG